ncbi:MAG TPA: alternate F1F0 ATPase, F1 subunit alpha [Bryobacteraceae bacterium]|nr:alternate F1F0 ATPase, F1 subunit alpha [Bryobacteraceae bacterium]
MSSQPSELSIAVDAAFDAMRQARKCYRAQLVLNETGTVASVSGGIARISGLPGVGYEELVEFESGLLGLTFDLDEEFASCVLLDDSSELRAGTRVNRTFRVMDIPVGESLLGRVVSPTGRALDGKGPLATTRRTPVERPAPQIMDRAPVITPLETGIKVVDALIPIGRGQRELILGDRQTGKTAIAVDVIANQKDKDVICVYCAIGQRSASVARVISALEQKGALAHTVVVVAEANEAPGLLYIAPYAATAIAEFFADRGQHALVVYDDLTSHARAYRSLSLLLRRPPGREAFPGDVFYLHSRLLERATQFAPELGGGSLTALPIIETEAQNLAAYIPTNLISITDGQLYLSPDLFQKGILPAVDVGKSVSRVGGKAQLAAYRMVAGDLKLAYSQFEELEIFSRFGTRLDEQTRKSIEHGNRIRECLKQNELEPVTITEQITILIALTAGLLDTVSVDRMKSAEQELQQAASKMPIEIRQRIVAGQPLSSDDRSAILAVAASALAEYRKAQ